MRKKKKRTVIENYHWLVYSTCCIIQGKLKEIHLHLVIVSLRGCLKLLETVDKISLAEQVYHLENLF